MGGGKCNPAMLLPGRHWPQSSGAADCPRSPPPPSPPITPPCCCGAQAHRLGSRQQHTKAHHQARPHPPALPCLPSTLQQPLATKIRPKMHQHTLASLIRCHPYAPKPTQHPLPPPCSWRLEPRNPQTVAPKPSHIIHRQASGPQPPASRSRTPRDVGKDSSRFKGASECPVIQQCTHSLGSYVTRLLVPYRAFK